MKLNYYADTDSLYIDLTEQVSVESREVSEGVVLDYAAGKLVGIDIDNASKTALIHHLVLNRLPATIAGQHESVIGSVARSERQL